MLRHVICPVPDACVCVTLSIFSPLAVSLNVIKRKHASFIQLVFICVDAPSLWHSGRFSVLILMLGEVQTHTYVALPFNSQYKLFVKIID
jgi:hypothetical protein